MFFTATMATYFNRNEYSKNRSICGCVTEVTKVIGTHVHSNNDDINNNYNINNNDNNNNKLN